MKISKIILATSIITGVLVTGSFAKGPGGNGNGSGSQGQGQCQGANAGNTRCDGTGPHNGDPTYCDASGPCQGTGIPLKDGSGKVTKGQGNPNSTGTPLKDGSGTTSAPGKGQKNGTGNNANCPNTAPKS